MVHYIYCTEFTCCCIRCIFPSCITPDHWWIMSTSSESLLRASLDLPGPQSFLVPLHVLQLEQFMIRWNILTCIEYSLHYNFLDTGGYDHVILSVSRGKVGAERWTRCVWWSKIHKPLKSRRTWQLLQQILLAMYMLPLINKLRNINAVTRKFSVHVIG